MVHLTYIFTLKNQVSIPFPTDPSWETTSNNDLHPDPPASVETNRGQANWATMKPAETVASLFELRLLHSPVFLWVNNYTICYLPRFGIQKQKTGFCEKQGFYNIYTIIIPGFYRKQKNHRWLHQQYWLQKKTGSFMSWLVI